MDNEMNPAFSQHIKSFTEAIRRQGLEIAAKDVWSIISAMSNDVRLFAGIITFSSFLKLDKETGQNELEKSILEATGYNPNKTKTDNIEGPEEEEVKRVFENLLGDNNE